MRNLAILIGLGWFWLAFYAIGPVTTVWDLVAGALTLAGGCLLATLCGIRRGALARRTPPRDQP